jgi:hypothetical protein
MNKVSKIDCVEQFETKSNAILLCILLFKQLFLGALKG